MKIFWPVMRQVPSSAGTALVVRAPTSDPAWGSVRFMVPVHSPVTILGRRVSRWASEPYCSSMSMAPCVRNGHSEKAMLAAVSISWMATATSHGKPPPPNSAGNGTAAQPPSTYWREGRGEAPGGGGGASSLRRGGLGGAPPVGGGGGLG